MKKNYPEEMSSDERFPASNVAPALENLFLPKYSGVRDLFERALVARSQKSNPGCSLFNLLALKADPLTQLNRDCSIYIQKIGLADAQKKCTSDVFGNIGRPAIEFNGSCADFWAEIAAIRTLAEKGYTQFQAIHKKQADGTTSDYEALYKESPVHIEVKNLRPNKTVTDVFHSMLRQLHRSEPMEYAFDIRVNFPYDDLPTGEQERAIRSYVTNMRGRKPPFHERILLGGVEAGINVVAGSGRAIMVRGIGPDSPEPLNKERFLRKIADKAMEARTQMKDDKRLKVLVINFDSPSGSISGDFIQDAEETIKTVFDGNVRPYVLLYRHLVELEH